MKITKELVKYFIEYVPLDIHYTADKKIGTVGVHWGYCCDANESFGRKTVMAILDKLETDKEYQKLLP